MFRSLLTALALAALTGLCQASSWFFLMVPSSLQRTLWGVLGPVLPDPKAAAIAMGMHQALISFGAIFVTLLVGLVSSRSAVGSLSGVRRYATLHTLVVCALVLTVYTIGLATGFSLKWAGFQQCEQFADSIFPFGMGSMVVIYSMLHFYYQKEMAEQGGDPKGYLERRPGPSRAVAGLMLWVVGLTRRQGIARSRRVREPAWPIEMRQAGCGWGLRSCEGAVFRWDARLVRMGRASRRTWMFRALWIAFWLTVASVVCYYVLLNILFPPSCAAREMIDGYHIWATQEAPEIFGKVAGFPSSQQMMRADALHESGYTFFALCLAMMVGSMLSSRYPGVTQPAVERYATLHASVVMVGATLFACFGRLTGYSLTWSGTEWCEDVLKMIIHYGMISAPVTYGLLLSYYHTRLPQLSRGETGSAAGPDRIVDGFFLWALGVGAPSDVGQETADEEIKPERDAYGRTVVGPS